MSLSETATHSADGSAQGVDARAARRRVSTGMSLQDASLAAFAALKGNALRSFLAMLGVIIGVAAVVVTVATGAGVSKAVNDTISSLGANMLTIRPGSSGFGGRRGGQGTDTPLNDEDVRAVRELDEIVYASGEIRGAVTFVSDGLNWSAGAVGVNADYFAVRQWDVGEGRFFAADEVEAGARVIVLGETVAEELYGSPGAAVGRMVRVDRIPFLVVGVAAAKGESQWGGDQDDTAMLPITTGRDRVFGGNVSVRDYVPSMYVEVAEGFDIDEGQAAIEDILRIRRDIRPGAEDDFRVFSFAEFIRARTETQRILGLALAVSAAICLLVGGIGIMNIMLVSVTERTREIGLRMALGARTRDVRNQFLIEATMLCGFGGLLGVVLGPTAAFIAGKVAGWEILVSPWTILLAFAVSTLVGVLFGLWPAVQASKLDPIAALRHD